MNIYSELEIKEYINAWGTVTTLGGSIIEPEVMEAMSEASQSFVSMDELHHKAGIKIAEMIGVEAAYITCGAAAGVAISTAACIAGTDLSKIHSLPDSTFFNNEVLILKSHRFRYDQGVKIAGGKLKEVGLSDLTLPEQLDNAITEKTVMLLYLAESEKLRGSLPLGLISDILKSRNIPIVVDAAAEIPPVKNLTNYIKEGADLVLFSGGKEIRGPQSSGLILGNKDLIKACSANSCPNHGIGRSMKVDKETIAGITKAVELLVKKDYKAEYKRWDNMASNIIKSLAPIDSLIVRKDFPSEPGIQPTSIPRVYLRINHTKEKISTQNFREILKNETPGIICGEDKGEIVLNMQTLKDGESEIISKTILNIFASKK